MNQVLENIKSRRSIRSFLPKPISREDLEIILEAGQYAPTGMNRQEFQFTVLISQPKLAVLAKAIREEIGADESYDFYGPNALILLSNNPENHNGMLDCACALQNIFLAAHSMGIGSVWINQLRDICWTGWACRGITWSGAWPRWGMPQKRLPPRRAKAGLFSRIRFA